ncbi:MAG: septum formation initiator family protein [Clostridiaceae bacterium]
MNKKSIKTIAINVIVLLLAAMLIFQFIGQRSTLSRIETEIAEKNKVLEDLRKKNEEMKLEIQNISSDEYIEKMARERLQMIKPDEIPVNNAPGTNTAP